MGRPPSAVWVAQTQRASCGPPDLPGFGFPCGLGWGWGWAPCGHARRRRSGAGRSAIIHVDSIKLSRENSDPIPIPERFCSGDAQTRRSHGEGTSAPPCAFRGPHFRSLRQPLPNAPVYNAVSNLFIGAHMFICHMCTRRHNVDMPRTHEHTLSMSYVYMSTQCSRVEPPAPQPHPSLPLELLLLRHVTQRTFWWETVRQLPHSECRIPNLFRLILLRKARTLTARELQQRDKKKK